MTKRPLDPKKSQTKNPIGETPFLRSVKAGIEKKKQNLFAGRKVSEIDIEEVGDYMEKNPKAILDADSLLRVCFYSLLRISKRLTALEGKLK